MRKQVMIWRQGIAVVALLAVPLTPAIASAPPSVGVSAQLIKQSVSVVLYPSNPVARSSSDDQVTLNFGPGLYSGLSVEGLSDLAGSTVNFRNGLIISGRNSVGTITTGVAITFTNNTSRAFRPVINSTLLAAGLGLYVSDQLRDPFGNNAADTCSSAALFNCAAQTQQSFRSIQNYANSWSAFDFDISVNGNSIYALGGKVGTDVNGVFYTDFAKVQANGSTLHADTILDNFQLISDPLTPWARGYAWNDTNVLVRLPDLVAPGASVTAIYTIKTSSLISPNAFGTSLRNGLNETQIAYAAFADPTGGSDPDQNIEALSISSFLRQALNSGPDTIDGLDLSGQGTFRLPGDGNSTNEPIASNRTYTATILNPVINDRDEFFTSFVGGVNINVVPEPASWAMLIAGFGLTGTMLRRRRMAGRLTSASSASTGARARSGASSIGICPTLSRIVTRAFGSFCENQAADATGISLSSRPQMIAVGLVKLVRAAPSSGRRGPENRSMVAPRLPG